MDYLSKLEVGVQIIDADMRYVYLNDSLLKQVGKTLEEHVGKKMGEVYPGLEESEVYATIKTCHATGERQRVLNEFAFDDGRMSYWELEFERIDNQVIMFSRDISHTKKGEKQLKESNKRLEKIVAQRTQELEESYLRMKRIIGHVSHDLRSPLVNIKNLLDMLNIEDVKGKQVLELIHNQSDKTLSLVKTILEEAAIGTGKIQLAIAENNLTEMIKKRLKLLETTGLKSANQLEINMAENIKVACDSFRMGQVLDNLISNAIKYSLDNSTIEIQLLESREFFIVNEGDEQKIEKSRRITKVENSVGFGIEIASSILQAHGSKLQLSNSNGKYRAGFKL